MCTPHTCSSPSSNFALARPLTTVFSAIESAKSRGKQNDSTTCSAFAAARHYMWVTGRNLRGCPGPVNENRFSRCKRFIANNLRHSEGGESIVGHAATDRRKHRPDEELVKNASKSCVVVEKLSESGKYSADHWNLGKRGALGGSGGSRKSGFGNLGKGECSPCRLKLHATRSTRPSNVEC